ncbi:alpha/beta fold hydrolase [Piscinibacter sp.]|uniref:alpha/beta fold hydrolase n=1 Tax=Piscinibacter sp. TaxID=1903157 RepID=UPI0039E321E4
MSLEVRRFGTSARQMVGLLSRGRPGARPRASFLLCRPFGQEGTRTASMYRVVADRLAREGSTVLTFDYHGTGDSPGEEADQTLADWSHDIEAAHRVLVEEIGAAVHWFGMGLACHAALKAAARMPDPPAHLVLWEPVLDGPDYVQRLFASHRQELEHEYHLPWERLLRQGRVVEPALPGDVLGFAVGPAFAAEMQNLAPLPLAQAMRRGVRITCGVHEEHEARLAALTGAGLVSGKRIESRTNWMLSQAMGSAIVPPEVLPALNETCA